MASSCEVSTRKQQQHVVAVPVPAQGHLNALMRFCKLLAAQGVRVTFVDVDIVHTRLEELNQQESEDASTTATATAKKKNDVDGITRVQVPIHGLDLANDFRLLQQDFLEAQNSVAPHLEDLIQKLNHEGPPVTCLLCDFHMALPIQKVAEKFGIPRIVLYCSSASMLLLIHYVQQGERISAKAVMEALARRGVKREVFCEGLPGLPTLHNNDLPSFKHVVDETPYVWESILQSWKECRHRAHAVVVSSFEGLEASALKALKDSSGVPVYGVGPLVESLHKENTTSLWKEDEACIQWLDKQPPLSVLYISFGSMTFLSQSQFAEILDGLLASQQRFLWAFRPDLVENAPYSSFPLDALSKSHGKGLAVDWAPQLRVLSHPSVGGFLTHCGWNSTMEAIAHGVPMLCWPYFADQFLDAKYVADELKVGLRFEASKEDDDFLVKRGEVEKVIRCLMEGMEGKVLRENVTHLKGAAYQSLLPGGTSYKDIQALVKSLM